ncbi:MAG: chlorophyll synthase ChlG [Marivita sp.]|uniref:chlorophyll synthase ChlG n=1 Tax=Marivita sp. TaxID=2003365 RepID=UPI0025C3B8AC|nr:chlorophyll synthase ChlG [Marivita sp.]MCI5113148.1 chlorophyll synthase ChlG [Marivita sp.]
MTVSVSLHQDRYPAPSAMLELIKPVTWFPPMWAYACGAVASGVAITEHLGLLIVGVILAGPVVCGMSQAANDWCDRHVDAINEPDRPIPSGRIPGRWGLWIALAMSALSLALGALLGTWGFIATVVGVIAAWAYSVEPIRLKRSGWFGPGLVGLSYESLPWFTGAAVLSQTLPSGPIILIALLYGIGAHGIMTLNDFKALEGDAQMGVNSLPVTLGPEKAAKVACLVMIVPQIFVILALAKWGQSTQAAIVLILLLGQLWAMSVMLKDPKAKAPWYNATGVLMYVSGMMVSAFALRAMGAL